jgi:hypothetical protein
VRRRFKPKTGCDFVKKNFFSKRNSGILPVPQKESGIERLSEALFLRKKRESHKSRETGITVFTEFNQNNANLGRRKQI